jgi:hypothetical protein
MLHKKFLGSVEDADLSLVQGFDRAQVHGGPIENRVCEGANAGIKRTFE